MCSVRLLIREVRIAICTSGEPESDSSRRYCPINSRFRSLVTVIAAVIPPLPRARLPLARDQRVRRISLRYKDFRDYSVKTTNLLQAAQCITDAGDCKGSRGLATAGRASGKRQPPGNAALPGD